MASAALQDFGIITEEDKTNVIDRVKITRARSTNRREHINESCYNHTTKNNNGVISLIEKEMGKYSQEAILSVPFLHTFCHLDIKMKI